MTKSNTIIAFIVRLSVIIILTAGAFYYSWAKHIVYAGWAVGALLSAVVILIYKSRIRERFAIELPLDIAICGIYELLIDKGAFGFWLLGMVLFNQKSQGNDTLKTGIYFAVGLLLIGLYRFGMNITINYFTDSVMLSAFGWMLRVKPAPKLPEPKAYQEAVDCLAKTLQDIEASHRELRSAYRELLDVYEVEKKQSINYRIISEILTFAGSEPNHENRKALLSKLIQELSAENGALWLTDKEGRTIRTQTMQDSADTVNVHLNCDATMAEIGSDRYVESVSHMLLKESLKRTMPSSAPQAVSLMFQDKSYGAVVLYHKNPSLNLELRRKLMNIAPHIAVVAQRWQERLALQEDARKSEALSRLTSTISAQQQDWDNALISSIAYAVDCLGCAVFRQTERDNSVMTAHWWNTDELGILPLNLCHITSDWAVSRKAAIYLSDLTRDPQWKTYLNDSKIGSLATIPMIYKNKLFGVVMIAHSQQNAFVRKDIESAKTLIRAAFEHSIAYQRMAKIGSSYLIDADCAVYAEDMFIAMCNNHKPECYIVIEPKNNNVLRQRIATLINAIDIASEGKLIFGKVCDNCFAGYGLDASELGKLIDEASGDFLDFNISITSALQHAGLSKAMVSLQETNHAVVL